MNIPRKINERTGGLMDRIVSTSNETIDYLKSTQLVGDGKTINVSDSLLGTTITAIPQKTVTSEEVDEVVEQKPVGLCPFDFNNVYAWNLYHWDDALSAYNENGFEDRMTWGEAVRSTASSYGHAGSSFDDMETTFLRFGFRKMHFSINGIYSEIQGDHTHRTISSDWDQSGPSAARDYGYTLDELASGVIEDFSSYQHGQPVTSATIHDAFYIKGILRLKVKLNFYSGSLSGLYYDDYYYDPFSTEWMVTHEAFPYAYAGTDNEQAYKWTLDQYTFKTLTLFQNNTGDIAFFIPLAYYLIYDCKDWIIEKMTKGSSHKPVRFKFRQVDFAPSLNITLTEQLKNSIFSALPYTLPDPPQETQNE